MPYRRDSSLRASREVLRSALVVGLLLLTAHRSPAPVVEGPPPFKRTFFTLKGHAVDTFANEKKLPPELAPAFTSATVLATQPLTELAELMKKFGSVASQPPEVLSAGPPSEEETPESQRREAAIQKIAKAQLKKIATNPTLPLAAGIGSEIKFSAGELSSAFFEGAWDIETAQPEELLTKGVKRPTRARIEIPISETDVRLFKYASKNDLEILRKASEDAKLELEREKASMRFFSEVARAGAPQRLFPVRVIFDQCGGTTMVIAEPPTLHIRVVVLENVREAAIDLGQFHFRMLDPGRGKLALRTRGENETLLATMNPDSQVWYKPRAVKPGERVIVPLELLFRPSHSLYANSEMEPGATRARRRTCANKLLADKELETVALMYEGKESGSEKLVPLVVMPKQKFVDGLLREPVPNADKEEFVYGSSILLDSVDVNGSRTEIEPFDPINVAYFSGYEGGSCPFVYSRSTRHGAWLKQGTIITGRSSKTREGTSVLQIHAFDGTLRIAEEEEEISYVDELFVRGTLASGEKVTLRPTDERLALRDRRYLILKKGDSIEIEFSVADGLRNTPVEVVASGYFELSPRPPRE